MPDRAHKSTMVAAANRLTAASRFHVTKPWRSTMNQYCCRLDESTLLEMNDLGGGVYQCPKCTGLCFC